MYWSGGLPLLDSVNQTDINRFMLCFIHKLYQIPKLTRFIWSGRLFCCHVFLINNQVRLMIGAVQAMLLRGSSLEGCTQGHPELSTSLAARKTCILFERFCKTSTTTKQKYQSDFLCRHLTTPPSPMQVKYRFSPLIGAHIQGEARDLQKYSPYAGKILLCSTENTSFKDE